MLRVKSQLGPALEIDATLRGIQADQLIGSVGARVDNKLPPLEFEICPVTGGIRGKKSNIKNNG